MCGIFGYAHFGTDRSTAGVLEILFNGLKRLEYRGYDSAGVCVDAPAATPQGPKPPLVIKAKGKVSALQAKASAVVASSQGDKAAGALLSSSIGIGHTRWATHGPPSPVNSHPHVSDPSGEFVVVHNGIITNYAELKEMLVHHGAEFVSQTDTEVVPKLCKFLYDFHNGEVAFTQLVMEVMGRLEGAFALLIKSTHYPDQLIACKRGSPLIMGVAMHDHSSASSAFDAALKSEAALSGPKLLKAPSVAAEQFKSAPACSPRAPSQAMECWLASDAAALLPHTRSVVVLEDNDLLHLGAEGYGVYSCGQTLAGRGSMSGLEVQRSLQTIDVEVEAIMKNGYDHYMQKEIHEQPKTLAASMAGRVVINKPLLPPSSTAGSIASLTSLKAPGSNRSLACGSVITDASDAASDGTADSTLMSPTTAPAVTINSDAGVFEAMARSTSLSLALHNAGGRPCIRLGGLIDRLEAIKRCRRLVFVACGTSYHSCMAARKTVEEFANMPVTLELASDMMDREAPVFRDDVCVFVSQSGETADTLRALDYAKSRGALCVGITNTVGSAISRATDCGVHVNAGYEIGVASTKAYTSQCLVLTMMALMLGEDSMSKASKRDSIIYELEALPDRVAAALKLDESIKKLALKLKDATSLMFFARGYNYATALEAALKVKEVALIHSEGINAGEMKHGPLALVDEHLPIVVIATRDTMHKKMESVIQQLLARAARLIILCNEGDPTMQAYKARGCDLIEVPKTEEALQPIVNIVPLQLLSYHLTTLRGFDVDQPRNLAKSVTVTEE